VTSLIRRLTTKDAVTIAISSMVGAGVFAAFGPAALAVHDTGHAWLLLAALALAAAVAFANATSSAQLAAQYPVAGGTYVYGRERLGPWAGFMAGWGYVIGKTASCTAMALTFAAHAVPDQAPSWTRRGVAAALVVAVAAVNYRGITRTVRVARWIVIFVLSALALTIALTWIGVVGGLADAPTLAPSAVTGSLGAVYGVLQAGGLLFFAFAGYARITSLGEEVINPRKAIPRAVVISFGIVAAIYALVAVTLLAVLGLDGTAYSTAPLADAVELATSGTAWAAPLVRVAATAASGGALLALMAGVGRTIFAMAREHDLPGVFTAIHPRYSVPHKAEIALAGMIVVAVLTLDLRGAIGFSGFGVLIYYLVANLSAWTQDREYRLYPRALQAFGALGCATLAVMLPWPGVAIGTGILLLGATGRALRLRRRI